MSEEKQKHSPTPWKQTCFLITSSTGSHVTHTGMGNLPPSRSSESEANAAHIVKCVNSHDALVAALMRCTTEMSSALDLIDETRIAGFVQALEATDEALGLVNPAIAELNAKVKAARAAAESK